MPVLTHFAIWTLSRIQHADQIRVRYRAATPGTSAACCVLRVQRTRARDRDDSLPHRWSPVSPGSAISARPGGISCRSLCCKTQLLDHSLAHDELLDLARDCHRERIDEANVPRHL